MVDFLSETLGAHVEQTRCLLVAGLSCIEYQPEIDPLPPIRSPPDDMMRPKKRHVCDRHGNLNCPMCGRQIPLPLPRLGQSYDDWRRLKNMDALRQHDARFDPGLERDQRGTPQVANCTQGGI